MPDLLLELFSEEIPARMQKRASDDLQKLVTNALVEAGLTYEGAKAFATPRRLALTVQGLTARSADTREERKGPKVGAPDKAVEGFMRAAGLASIDEAQIQSDPKKGDFYVAVIEKAGRAAEEIIADAMPGIISNFPWPKSMRWGAASAEAGSLRWVRPLRSILCTFGPDTEEPEIVSFEVSGIRSGNTTYGHRFMAPDAITIRRFDDYVDKLNAAKVVLDGARREDLILQEAKSLAQAQNLELVEDAGLLHEVAGLVEWPVVMMGSFDARFLELPDEVIQLTIKTNQKCFVLKGADGKLTNKFILVSNLVASDGGKEIVAGNEKVVRARLADAMFFWETDLKVKLEDQTFKLQRSTFHECLGSQKERIDRIAWLVRPLAPNENPDQGRFVQAAKLCKADLATEMVKEFPDLQGFVGSRYALEQNIDPEIANVCEEHYQPRGASDDVPSALISNAVSIADRIDMLTGFWMFGLKPTGSGDPYALRRAALGLIRIVHTNGLSVRLRPLMDEAWRLHTNRLHQNGEIFKLEARQQLIDEEGSIDQLYLVRLKYNELADDIASAVNEQQCYFVSKGEKDALDQPRPDEFLINFPDNRVELGLGSQARIALDLLSFFHDRLKVYLRDQGRRHDLIDAVITPESDDLLLIVRRVEALSDFLATEDGAALLAGTKRAANILRAEEKKDGKRFDGLVNAAALTEDAEKALAAAVDTAVPQAEAAVARNDFAGAMSALAGLRGPVDAFFDHVMVNVDDASVRENRLNLLNRIRVATATVADFSKIEG